MEPYRPQYSATVEAEPQPLEVTPHVRPAKRDLFIAVLRSDTVQNALINRFDLRKVYWDRYYDTARKDLARFTDITEDRKSGVIKIEVTDRNRERAARLAQAYVEELDRAVAQL